MSKAFVDRYFTGNAGRRSKASVSTGSPRRRRAGTDWPSATRRCCATRSTLAVTSNTGCAARSMSGRRRRWGCFSTRSAPVTDGRFKAYARKINDQSKKLKNLRGLFEFKKVQPPVPIEEVEPASAIVTRFATGAMVRFDLLGGTYDTGGGDEPDRRQVEHRRGRRGVESLPAAAEMAIRCARRSSRSPRDGLA